MRQINQTIGVVAGTVKWYYNSTTNLIVISNVTPGEMAAISVSSGQKIEFRWPIIFHAPISILGNCTNDTSYFSGKTEYTICTVIQSADNISLVDFQSIHTPPLP